MKISSPTHRRRNLAIASLLALVVIGVGVAAAYHYRLGPFKKAVAPASINLAPPSPDQKKAGDFSKQNTVQPSAKQSPSGSDQPPPPVPQTGTSKDKVNVTITAANQTSSTYQIRALIEAVVSNGTCTLTLTNSGGQSVVQTAGVQALSTTSTCKGFDVPLSSLSPGTWNLVLSYDSPTLSGSATKSITVK